MKVSVIIILLLGIVLTSCSSKSVHIDEIKELNRQELKKCSYLNSIDTEVQKGNEKSTEMQLKIKVHKLDGDAYFIDESVQNGATLKVSASAYKCKN